MGAKRAPASGEPRKVLDQAKEEPYEGSSQEGRTEVGPDVATFGYASRAIASRVGVDGSALGNEEETKRK